MQRTPAVVALAGMLAAISVPALAGDRNSLEDQMACTPDVYRLCSQYVPNEDAIVACLQKNKPNLSAACHRVFSEPNDKPNNDDD